MATPKRVSYSICLPCQIADLQNKFEPRFTDISHSPFIRAPALTALRTINQSLYNDHEITVEVLEGFLDGAGKKVEFRLALLTWHFDARPKSEVSKEMVDFVGSCTSLNGLENASLSETLESIWKNSSFYYGKNNETLEIFQLRVVEVLVCKAFIHGSSQQLTIRVDAAQASCK
jgi:hypothetical protein